MSSSLDPAAANGSALDPSADPRLGQVRQALPRLQPLKRDIDRFRDQWPEPDAGRPFPTFTWEQLTRQVEDLAATDAGRRIAAEALSGLAKLAPWMPPELVLREALGIAWAAMDEGLPERPAR